MGQARRGGEVSGKLVGGSHGEVERAYFASVQDCVDKGCTRTTSRRREGSENLTGVKSFDLSRGDAPIDNVLSYNQGNAAETARLKAIHEGHGGKTIPGARGASASVPVLSVETLFWERLSRLGAAEQIEVINESIGQTEGRGASLEVAANMVYDSVKEGEGAEPRSEFHISDVTFLIASAHSYKFHEQSLESHPGLAGTQKEVELATMQHALARYYANALPRLGAVGGIADSKYFVVVNGVKIAYLAWSPAPGSHFIHISDYMAVQVPKIPTNA